MPTSHISFSLFLWFNCCSWSLFSLKPTSHIKHTDCYMFDLILDRFSAFFSLLHTSEGLDFDFFSYWWPLVAFQYPFTSHTRGLCESDSQEERKKIRKGKGKTRTKIKKKKWFWNLIFRLIETWEKIIKPLHNLTRYFFDLSIS